MSELQPKIKRTREKGASIPNDFLVISTRLANSVEVKSKIILRICPKGKERGGISQQNHKLEASCLYGERLFTFAAAEKQFADVF